MELNADFILAMQRQMKDLNKFVKDAVNSPLEKGIMDAKEHAEFKKDIDIYSKLLVENRDAEAESFLKKITEKYDKPNV